MLKIKGLDPGCSNYKQLGKIALNEVEKSGLNADIEKMTAYGQIMTYGVMSTPGLVVKE